MYLLDTNVISELRKAPGGRANPGVVAWSEAQVSHDLYLSVITLMELEMGILQVEHRGDIDQGRRLRKWFETQVVTAFEGRVLPIDAAVAARCAQLMIPDPQSPWDALIAATALHHNLTVVTRNVRDYEASGVPAFDPWNSP